jgi:putative acetyltransferase
VRIHRAARAQALPWLPVLHTPEEEAAYFAGAVGRGEVTVAELDGRVAGFASVAELLDHLYVAPEAQGLGLGSALLYAARALRPDGLALWTFQRNIRARRFYEQRGFGLVRLTDGSGNEEREPDALYRLPVC